MCGGFSIEPYDQEIERYGGPDAITAAEDTFAADSRLALAFLQAAADPAQRLIAAAHCAAATALSVATADPFEAIGRPRLDRAARRRYCAGARRAGCAGPTWIWTPDWPTSPVRSSM